MKKSDSNIGCLFVVVVILCIVGNVYCLNRIVGGDGLWDDGFSILMSLIAVASDVVVVYYAISALIRSAKRNKEERERNRINSFIQQFSPGIIITTQKAKPFDIEPQLINKEIVFSVYQLKEELHTKIEEYCRINREIGSILGCNGCKTYREKEEYLKSKAEELNRLKTVSDTLIREINHKKIHLKNEDEIKQNRVKEAFSSLLTSQKCVFDNSSLERFICKKPPMELNYFKYKSTPAIIRIKEFYFCLFNKVILVFDNSGIFTTAIDPSALQIEVNRMSDRLRVFNNSWLVHDYIAPDSKLINTGSIMYTWKHTCVDGSRDRRYKDNPTYEYRINTYEYGHISVSIAGNTVSMYVSSRHATDSLENAGREYSRRCITQRIPIPEFIDLIGKVSDKNDQNIAYVSKEYQQIASKKLFFCEVI